MQKQVDRSIYAFGRYLDKRRWASIWHQVDEVLKLGPARVLEIGPGPGVFKALMGVLGVTVETLDLDPDLRPDYLASVLEMPFREGAYDVVCAFQMLEHLPFDKSLEAFGEMARVARRNVVISLPDAATRWPLATYIPKIGSVSFSVPMPRLKAPIHRFNGQHHWEINKRGFPLNYILDSLLQAAPLVVERTYRVPENPYHRFFIFSKPVSIDQK